MSSDLTSKFSRDDIETLIEAMGDWEMIGNHEFHVLQMIKNAPMPPEDHEAHESMTQIKDYFRQREKEIMASRAVRQEKSVFIKAKLMMVRRDLGVNQLFEMAAEEGEPAPAPAKQERPARKKLTKQESADFSKRLEMAEFFIKDLGVWDHYQKFLAEKKESEAQETAEEKTDD